MKKQQLLVEAGALSERDRLELAIELWDSVDAESADLPLTDVQRSELDRRLDAYLADRGNTFPAEAVLDELEREL
jgi:putative addiction module component (TIGR02574 family)